MRNKIFSKSIFISLLGHITVFSIFGFTFGSIIPKVNYAPVSFLGSILASSDLNNFTFTQPIIHRGVGFGKKANTLILDTASRGYIVVLKPYFKPCASLSINQEKRIVVPTTELTSFAWEKREPVITFYPHLPYHFLLYFKDRQKVHIELMFNIISNARRNRTLIRRKVSSGNLEVDLLSMRYIGHYLFVQQGRFTPNTWQTVKIDLSARND